MLTILLPEPSFVAFVALVADVAVVAVFAFPEILIPHVPDAFVPSAFVFNTGVCVACIPPKVDNASSSVAEQKVCDQPVDISLSECPLWTLKILNPP